MLPIPPEYSLVVAIAIAFVVGFGAVVQFLRSMKKGPDTTMRMVGAALGDSAALNAIAETIEAAAETAARVLAEEHHRNRKTVEELGSNLRALAAALDNHRRALDDATAEMRRHK